MPDLSHTIHLASTFVMDGVSHEVNGRLTLSPAIFGTVATDLTLHLGNFLSATWQPGRPLQFINNSAEIYGTKDHKFTRIDGEVLIKQVIPELLKKLGPDPSSL